MRTSRLCETARERRQLLEHIRGAELLRYYVENSDADPWNLVLAENATEEQRETWEPWTMVEADW